MPVERIAIPAVAFLREGQVDHLSQSPKGRYWSVVVQEGGTLFFLARSRAQLGEAVPWLRWVAFCLPCSSCWSPCPNQWECKSQRQDHVWHSRTGSPMLLLGTHPRSSLRADPTGRSCPRQEPAPRFWGPSRAPSAPGCPRSTLVETRPVFVPPYLFPAIPVQLLVALLGPVDAYLHG